MRPGAATLTLLVLAAALVGAGVVGGHSVNYVSADPQVTPDGTVVVEGAFVEESGWAVVHERTADGYGEALGATRLPRRNAFYTDIAVTIEDGAWANWTTREVVVVLHGEDGDGEYTSEDPPLGGFGVIVTDRFVVERGDRAVVTGEDDFPQRADGPTVTVRQATLPERGHLVVRNRTADGRVVGTRTLDTGTYENVSVAVNESFYESTGGSFAARVSLHRDDGDRRFDGDEPPIEAGNETVATRFSVEPERSGGIVTTPVPTTAPPGGDGGATGNASATPGDGTTETGGQPGFGPVVIVAAAAVVALALGRARREA
ncbi:DUF7282 domain-containing protein [Haloglomus litoreum]|uniref:DUF7282 domain-containing protein n=1 Tax=Haloglomus litoreum TaxID=3034026 RepID=UPI0023E8E185|nr:hypothetical protein [Haloglomus sp. DT116]